MQHFAVWYYLQQTLAVDLYILSTFSSASSGGAWVCIGCDNIIDKIGVLDSLEL